MQHYQHAQETIQSNHTVTYRMLLSKLGQQWQVNLFTLCNNFFLGLVNFDNFDDLSISDLDFRELSHSSGSQNYYGN